MRKYIYLSLLILAGCDNHNAANPEPVSDTQQPPPIVEKVVPIVKTTAKPLTTDINRDTSFSESTFGSSFSHPDTITLKHISLARTNAYTIFFKNINSGNFTIKELPSKIKIESFLAVGKRLYRKQFKATNFESKDYTAPTGLKFFTLRCHVNYKGIPRTLERFIHITPLNATTNRVFLFEFYLTNHTYRRQHPAFLKMINTFMLTKRLPDSGKETSRKKSESANHE